MTLEDPVACPSAIVTEPCSDGPSLYPRIQINVGVKSEIDVLHTWFLGGSF